MHLYVYIVVHINSELDELEREEFTRLKIVKAKKVAYLKAKEIEFAQLEEAARSVMEFVSIDATSVVDDMAVNALAADSTTTTANTKKKGGKKNKDKKPESALAGFDAGDDADVVFK